MPQPFCPFSLVLFVKGNWHIKLWLTQLSESFLNSRAYFTSHIIKCILNTDSWLSSSFLQTCTNCAKHLCNCSNWKITPLALFKGTEFAFKFFFFCAGSRPKQINQPHASKRGHKLGRGGLVERCQKWQREGYGHAKKTDSARARAAFSRRGSDMCLVMQQPPHQPKLELTEVIKRRKAKEEEGSPSCPRRTSM